MIASIFISGRITQGETLKDVIRQYKSFETPTEVIVHIKSNGGNKDEGNAVYNYLKNIDAEIPVTTKAEKAYSIAAKIFAAGSTRIVEDKENVIGVHFARVTPKGTFTAEQMEAITEELFEIKQEFIDFYSEHLNIDKGTVETLLDEETILSGKEAVELGFATRVEEPVEIIAELTFDKSNINNMKKDKSKKSFLKKLADDIAAYLNNEEEAEVVAELTLQDSNGTEIVFPNLESDATPKVGDKATIDGAAIPDGSYIMPSLEDATVVFAGGEVSEIIPKEEEETETEVEARFDKWKTDFELKAETDGIEISTWSMRLVNDSFAVGDILKCYGWEDEENIVATAEVKIPDGRTVVTDASGKIVVIKEADSEEQIFDETETVADFDDLKKKMSKKLKSEIEAELKAEYEAEISRKNDEIKALKKKVGSKEFTAEQEEESPANPVKEKGASRYLQAAQKL